MAAPAKGIGLLIGLGGKPGADESADDPRETAAKAFLAAVADKDAKGLVDALDMLLDSREQATDEEAKPMATDDVDD